MPLREIRLEFTQPPALAMTSVMLTRNQGFEIEQLSLSLDGNTVVATMRRALSLGRYRVAWKTAGPDGHPVSGIFFFDVATGVSQPPSPVPSAIEAGQPMAPMEMHRDAMSLPDRAGFDAESPAYAAIRFVQFLALVLLLGAFAFRHVVLRLLEKQQANAGLVENAIPGVRRVAMTAASVLLVFGIFRLAAQSYAMHGSGQSVFGMMMPMITGTSWGAGWLMQMAGSALVVAGLGRRANAGWNMATAGALVVAFSPALSGHAASAPHFTGLAVASDGLHVIGAGGWLGSLFLVVAVGVPAAMRLEEDDRNAAVANLVNAFSPTALLFAGIAATTGVFAAWLHIGSIRGLYETSYGQRLLLKLAILSVVAATGAYNWLRVRPNLGNPDGTRRLNLTARSELLVAVLVIAVTAVLVATPTSIDEELMKPTSAPQSQSQASGP